MIYPARSAVRALLRADTALALTLSAFVFLSLSPVSADPPARRGILAGPVASAVTGSVTGGRCDVNDDGLDDALTADNQRPTNVNYVVFGQRTPPRSVDLAAPFRGFRIIGAEGSPTAATGCAGDVNRDGRDDVLVGSWFESPLGRAQAGTVYVVFGKRDFADVDVRNLGRGGFRIDGERARHRIGVEEVSGAGDVNRDGYDDVIVGANGGDDKGANRGAAYIVFGKRDTAPVDLANIALGNGGYKIVGAQSGDRAGFAVAYAGDVNRDGIPDQLIGAYTALRNAQSTAGEAYVVFGKKRNTTPIDLATSAWSAFCTPSASRVAPVRSDSAYTQSRTRAATGDGSHDSRRGSSLISSGCSTASIRTVAALAPTSSTANPPTASRTRAMPSSNEAGSRSSDRSVTSSTMCSRRYAVSMSSFRSAGHSVSRANGSMLTNSGMSVVSPAAVAARHADARATQSNSVTRPVR